MTIEIKQADLKDLDVLMAWRMEVLHEVFDLPDDDKDPELYENNRQYYLHALPEEHHIACFALADGEIIGCGGICLQREMPSPDNRSGTCGYLMNIYTRQPYRHQGVGKQIVRWVINQARERHAEKIYLETSDDGRPMYEQLGFEDLQGYMKLSR